MSYISKPNVILNHMREEVIKRCFSKESWPSSERRLPSPQLSRTFTPLCASDHFFFLSHPEAWRGVLRSRAIDHCRESHAFAQVSIQGSFPPLRCTNPPVCVHTRIAVARACTLVGEPHAKLKRDEIHGVVLAQPRLEARAIILQDLRVSRSRTFCENFFPRISFENILRFV